MAVYAARTRPGPPENGRYQNGDVVPDSNGVVWICVKGGMAGYLGDATFAASPSSLPTTTAGVGAPAGAGNVAAEYGDGTIHQTVLTLTDVAVAVADVSQFGSLKIYDFPEGRIQDR